MNDRIFITFSIALFAGSGSIDFQTHTNLKTTKILTVSTWKLVN